MKTAFNTKLAREDTIACSEIIHFNNAGSSLMPKPVSEVLHAYLYKEERFGGYETAFLENEAIENFYVAAGRLLNCDTDEGIEKCGIVTFKADQLNPDQIKNALAEQKINVSTSSSAGSLVSFQQRGLKAVVRASLHYFNTLSEIEYFVTVLEKILHRKS